MGSRNERSHVRGHGSQTTDDRVCCGAVDRVSRSSWGRGWISETSL